MLDHRTSGDTPLLHRFLFIIYLSSLTMLSAPAAIASQSATAELLGNGVEPPPAAEWLLQDTLLEPDGDAFVQPHFGWSVALDGDTALVGRLDVDDAITQSRAYVFVREGGAWGLQATLRPADHPLVCPIVTSFGDRKCPNFGFAVALSGDVAVVGQPGASSTSDNTNYLQGAAYVFVRQGDAWVEQAKLAAPDGEAGDRFGWSVAVSGDTVVVGAPLLRAERPGLPLEPHGAVYVFGRQGDDWVAQARLDPEGFPLMCARVGGRPRPQCPNYGYAVAVEGDTVLVGASGEEVDGSIWGGAAYAFTRDGGGTWHQQARLVASDTAHRHRFGTSLALAGDTALIGAHSVVIDGNLQQGAAYIFTRSGEMWTEQQKLTASDGATGDWFGGSVALFDDTALVGAHRHLSGGDGAVYRYIREGSAWNEAQKLSLPPMVEMECGASELSCVFGTSVSLSGNAALVGSPGVGNESLQGAAFVFVGTDAALVFEPASLNFGTVEVGDTGGPLVAALRNTGDETLTGLAFADPGPGFEADTAACGVTLDAGASCAVSVTFTPSVSGPAGAVLQVESNEGPAASLTLSGSGGPDDPLPDPIFRDRFELK